MLNLYSCAPYSRVSPEGWAFKAIGCWLYPDGRIEWDYSIHGHWIDGRPKSPPKHMQKS